MISYPVYKIIHLFGIFLIVAALGGVCLHTLNGGTRTHPFRKRAGMTHGIGLFLALLGGFGLLARLDIHWPWPLWVALKLTIWLFLGGAIALAYRSSAKWLWWALPVLGGAGAYLAIQKPF